MIELTNERLEKWEKDLIVYGRYAGCVYPETVSTLIAEVKRLRVQLAEAKTFEKMLDGASKSFEHNLPKDPDRLLQVRVGDVDKAVTAAVKAERAACAKLCDKMEQNTKDGDGDDDSKRHNASAFWLAASAIRARCEQTEASE